MVASRFRVRRQDAINTAENYQALTGGHVIFLSVYNINKILFFLFKKINDLLHGAWWQTMVATT